MRGPKNDKARELQTQAAKKGLTVRDWRLPPNAEMVARRGEVWGLLGWYHTTVVKPHLGLRGILRRLWWRLMGKRTKLLSPWEAIAIDAELARRRMELEVQRAAAEGPPPDIAPANGNPYVGRSGQGFEGQDG